MIEQLAEVAGRDVSRETLDRLQAYAALLRNEAAKQNLISLSTVGDLWVRHVLDSAQLVRFEPKKGASWVDIGSGAGLPGVIVACLVEGPVLLVEPRRLRADFLGQVIEKLALTNRVEVRQEKVERTAGKFDVISARAVARLPELLGISQHLSTGKTVWALPKGRGAFRELAEAQETWQGVFHVERSATDDEAYIVVGTGVRVKPR